jgi:hypothetical protein
MDSALLVEPLWEVTLLVLNMGGSSQRALLVAESLANNLEFIKARFHIDRFITDAVDTEAERANTKALQTNLASASTRIDVSISSSHDL